MNSRPNLRLAGQRRLVLQYLVDYHPIGLTNAAALIELRVGRLASRVSELIPLGAPILMEWRTSGSGNRFGCYRLTDLQAAKALLETVKRASDADAGSKNMATEINGGTAEGPRKPIHNASRSPSYPPLSDAPSHSLDGGRP